MDYKNNGFTAVKKVYIEPNRICYNPKNPGNISSKNVKIRVTAMVLEPTTI